MPCPRAVCFEVLPSLVSFCAGLAPVAPVRVWVEALVRLQPRSRPEASDSLLAAVSPQQVLPLPLRFVVATPFNFEPPRFLVSVDRSYPLNFKDLLRGVVVEGSL